ncbi:LLM class flavin-dependent oxidoreductase [Streptosporangium sp. NPDC003464]
MTERIRVRPEVLLAPLRDPVPPAKQSATLDRLSGGRFTLGLGAGAREDDFQCWSDDTQQIDRLADLLA